MKRSVLVSLFVLLAPLTLSPALAQSEGDAQAYQEAKEKATKAFNGGEYEEAALLFKEAFDVQPRGNLLYNIGLCYEKAENLGNAVRFYQRYVEAVPNSNKRAQVQLKISELKQKMEHLYVTVSVTSSPDGAVVFVDAKANGAMGKTPVEFQLLPGTYTILGELEGYELAKKKVTLDEEKQISVNLKMLSSARVGEVSFMIPVRGAVLKVDGKVVGTAPFTKPVRLKQGTRKLEVTAEGRKPWRREIQVKARGSQRVKVSFDGDDDFGGGGGGGGSVWPWVTMGTGGALLIGGGIFGLQAQTLYDQLDEKRSNNELIAAADIDTGNSQVTMTNILLISGSLVTVGGLAWWFFDRKSDDSAASASPFVGFAPTQEGGAAFQIQGAF